MPVTAEEAHFVGHWISSEAGLLFYLFNSDLRMSSCLAWLPLRPGYHAAILAKENHDMQAMTAERHEVLLCGAHGKFSLL